MISIYRTYLPALPRRAQAATRVAAERARWQPVDIGLTRRRRANGGPFRNAGQGRKLPPLLAARLVTRASLTVPLAPSAQAAPARPGIFPAEWCMHHAPPCVVSASRNGVPITESDPTYAVSAAGSLQPDGEFLTQWGIGDALIGGGFETLAPGDVGVPFSITVDVGAHSPRVVAAHTASGSCTQAL